VGQEFLSVLVAHLSPTKLTPWSFTIAQTRSIPPLNTTTIITMALSPTLVAVADHTGLRIWEGVQRDLPKDAFNCLYQCQLDPQSPTTILTFSKSGTHLAAGNTVAEVRIWNVDTGKITHHIDTGHSALGNPTSICSLAFDGDEHLASAGKQDSQAHVWHIHEKTDIGSTRLQTEPGKWESTDEPPPTITHVVSAGHLVLTASNDQAVTIWKILPTPPSLIEHLETIHAVAISPSHADPSSEFGATATAAGKKVKIWDHRDTLRTCISLTDTVRALTYSASGKRLIIANDAPDISVWAPNGPEGTFLYTLKVPCPYPKPAHTLSLPSVRYTTLAVSDNDKRIAAGTSWGQVILWNTAHEMHYSQGNIITPHLYPVISIEFTDKGATISRSTDNFLHIVRTVDSPSEHPIALAQQTAHGHLDTHRQKYITTLRRGILHIYHDGPFLHVVLPSHPVAFLRAPANITTVACRDTRILVGCTDGSVTHAFAPFLSAPLANGPPIKHLISIDLQALVTANKTTARDFTIQVPLYLSALEIKTIVAARASIPVADVHLSFCQHPEPLPLAKLEPNEDPLYAFRLTKTPTLRATPHPLTEEQIQASAQPTPPTGQKRVHIFPPFDLNRNHPNEDKDWTFHIDLYPTSTCSELFQLIESHTHIPQHGFYLKVQGIRVSQILEEDNNALFADLSSGDIIHVHLRLFAGNEDHSTSTKSGNPHGQIFVKTYTGKTITLSLDPSTTTAAAKREIEAKQGTPVIQQRLIFAGKQMEDQEKLSRYGVSDGSTIYQILAGKANAFQLLLQHNKQREALQKAAAREEEETRDTAGFQKADEQQQQIQQRHKDQRLKEEQQTRDKEAAQTLLNAQLKTLMIEQDRAETCPLADTPEKATAATNTAIMIYKTHTNRNLGTQAASRLLLHLRAKTQEGRKIRTDAPYAPPNRADRVQFLLTEPVPPPTPHTHPTTVEEIQAAYSSFTTKLSVVEVDDPTHRHTPQLFKITCDGTLTESIPFLEAGFVTIYASGTARFFLIEKQHDPASQLVIRPAPDSSENWTMILASLIGMEASSEQFQDAILAMIHASNPTQPLPLEVRLEQSKRIGPGWHRATVDDTLGKSKKNTNTATTGTKAHPPYTPKITLVYPSPEAAAATLATTTTLHIAIANTFEESQAASSTNEHTLRVKLQLRRNDSQPRQAEGIEGTTDALISLARQHNERLHTIVRTHIPKIISRAHLDHISDASAIAELGHQLTDIANINPTLGPYASSLEAEIQILAQTASPDLTSWQNDSPTLKALYLLHELQLTRATLAPMPKLPDYNTTDYPANTNKRRAKILEVISRKAKEAGINFASIAWIMPPRRDQEPSQILVTIDDATAASIRNLAPAKQLGTLLAVITSKTTNPPLHLTILRGKLQTAASTTHVPASTGPLSAHPPEVQRGAVALYNVMLKGDLIWVRITDVDNNLVHISNKQHTPRDKLQPADVPLYIANMCIDQEPLQALAALTTATASASGKIYEVTSIAISPQIRVYSLRQILAILTTNFSVELAVALLPASMDTDQPEAFITEFFGKSTAALVNECLNTHYIQQAIHIASTQELWLASPAMANQQGSPPAHLPAQDREAARRWQDNPPSKEQTIRTPLSGHPAESSRPEVDIDLEDHTQDHRILAKLVKEVTLHASHKDGASLLTSGNSDLLLAVERTLIPAGSVIPWSSLEVNETETATAATLCFDILRGRDSPVHIRTSALQDLDEFTMAEQTGLHSLTSHINSDILTKGEWGKKRMHHLIVEACRLRVNTGHHTPLEDSTGHLLLLTPLTWSHTPVTMSVMYGPNWKGIAAAAAADRGRADQTLKLAKLQAAQRVLLDECQKTPIHIVSASVVNEVIHLTGPARTTDPSTDPSSLSHSGRQQHPYNSTAQGIESATALEALTDLLRKKLIVATPHQEGLLLAPHIPPNNPTNAMRIDGHPRGEDGAAANRSS
jgi:WD40 repeat protein